MSGRANGTRSARKRAVTRAVKEVAGYLGNTPAVARSSYIDPRVIDRFTDGQASDVATVGEDLGDPAGQATVERAVLELIEG